MTHADPIPIPSGPSWRSTLARWPEHLRERHREAAEGLMDAGWSRAGAEYVAFDLLEGVAEAERLKAKELASTED